MVFESNVFDLTKSRSRGSEMYLGSHESLSKGDLPIT